jgi:IS5 family transposase
LKNPTDKIYQILYTLSHIFIIIKNFFGIGLNEAYKRVERLGDRLVEIGAMIDWDAFRPIVGDMFDNRGERGGRPNIDEVVMVKLLVLQQWHGLSDPELEKQAADRLSFMKFLDFPKDIPDFTTVWRFRERLAETGRDQAIWAELQRQLDALGLKVRKGVVQDASFITADPGHAKADTPRGDVAKTRRSADGTWAKKGSKSIARQIQTLDSYENSKQPQHRLMTARWTSPKRAKSRTEIGVITAQ